MDCDAFYSIFIYRKSLISVLWVFQIQDVSVFLACSGVCLSYKVSKRAYRQLRDKYENSDKQTDSVTFWHPELLTEPRMCYYFQFYDATKILLSIKTWFILKPKTFIFLTISCLIKRTPLIRTPPFKEFFAAKPRKMFRGFFGISRGENVKFWFLKTEIK